MSLQKEDIVIAGFDFFRDEATCQSREIYLSLKKEAQISTYLLPVYWQKIEGAIAEVINLKKKVILFLGNGRGDKYRCERLGINVAGSHIRDNGDQLHPSELIDKSGPAAIFETLDALQFASLICQQGLPCVPSYYGGIFLCNYVLYKALLLTQNWTSIERPRIGLLHLAPERDILADWPHILTALMQVQ